MLLGWLALAVSPLASAALGGDATSVEADRAQMKAQARTATSAAGYTVQQFELPSGTLVHEFVSAQGKVFAVSWHGPSVPDLRTTLGGYFEQFVAAANVPRHGHHPLYVQQPDLVVQSNGHARSFAGRAYVPSLLPPDFSVAAIQ
jgi:Protein of unknown function (DUF2844)